MGGAARVARGHLRGCWGPRTCLVASDKSFQETCRGSPGRSSFWLEGDHHVLWTSPGRDRTRVCQRHPRGQGGRRGSVCPSEGRSRRVPTLRPLAWLWSRGLPHGGGLNLRKGFARRGALSAGAGREGLVRIKD